MTGVLLGFQAHPLRVSGELEVSLLLRSRERAHLLLSSFLKVLWYQRYGNERLLYLLWCVRTKLETFPVLGWKCQLIIWKGRVHRAYLSESDEMASKRYLVIGSYKWYKKSMGPEGMQASLWNVQAGFRVSCSTVYFEPHLKPYWCDRVAATTRISARY